MNEATGEVVQMTFFEDETLQRAKVRYDWNPFPGRHVNIPKELGAKLYAKGSGYTQKDRDIFLFYCVASPDGAEPLRLTYKEIASMVGGRPDTISKSLGKLHAGGLLLKAETIGKVIFYRLNPRAGYDGPAAKQVEAVKDARLPVIPVPTATTKEAS
ncbi:transcriptional regulator [Streptomyces chrestomyceticus]|uniref:transcriptional regulator n=1 Tax=Streptomyces chrestomyceticus TaxID=68185 RepID=UPI0033FD8788